MCIRGAPNELQFRPNIGRIFGWKLRLSSIKVNINLLQRRKTLILEVRTLDAGNSEQTWVQNLNRIIPKFGRMLNHDRTEPSRSHRPNIRSKPNFGAPLLHCGKYDNCMTSLTFTAAYISMNTKTLNTPWLAVIFNKLSAMHAISNSLTE